MTNPLSLGLKNIWLCALLCLIGCAGANVSDLYEFHEVESQNESKLFNYQFVLDPAQRSSASRRDVPTGFAASFSDMRDELEIYMRTFPYCLEGYFIYDETFDGERYMLHGECQESKSATQ